MEKITKQQIPVLTARLVEFQEKFAPMSKEDAQWVIQNSQEAIKLFIEALESRNKGGKQKNILSLLSEKLIIPSLPAGWTTIARAKKTFRSFIDSDFKNWDLDNKQSASEETEVKVYELKQDVNFSQMFNSLNTDLEKLYLTQSQIIYFCERHFENLRQDGYATFFLFKENNEFFVAEVYVNSDGLNVYVFRFEYDGVWFAEYAYRLVVPATI